MNGTHVKSVWYQIVAPDRQNILGKPFVHTSEEMNYIYYNAKYHKIPGQDINEVVLMKRFTRIQLY